MALLLPAYTTGALTTDDGAVMYYTIVGKGTTPIVLLAGAGDGLRTVNMAARPLAWLYRRRAHAQSILFLSRRQPIPEGYSVAQHADDMLWAMQRLSWQSSILECNSAGGPIGQWMAVKQPELVRGLILSCTLHRADESIRSVLQHWIELADQGKWAQLNWSSIVYTYNKTLWLYRLFRPFLPLIGKPRYPQRMQRILSPLLQLDNSPILPQISCPALIIGGADDRVIGSEIQREMAALIPNSNIQLFPGYGHGNDQENPAYTKEVMRFIEKINS